ncbi:MAG TPA: class I SAM-dependent methyltransferase, partial [Phycicoccus sp.]|nr:class I SAM-dependent methyltransferase [Phycicoccus sp.]
QLSGKGTHYYEHYYTPRGLRRLFGAFDVWDYTLPVIADPTAFAGDDVVPAFVSRLPERALAGLLPLVPTYVWLAFKGSRMPSGPDLVVAPRHLSDPDAR